MDDFEFAEDMEEEGARGDERQNRTFIILVAVMGGLLLIGIVAFCAWAILFSQRMLGGGGETIAEVAATQTIDAAMAFHGLTATAEAVQTEMAEPPTATPQPPAPTSTPTVAAAAGPTRVAPTATSPSAAGGGAVPVASPTAQSAAGAQPTATATAQPPRELSETGLGTSTIIILAAVFLFILIMARRLRTVQ